MSPRGGKRPGAGRPPLGERKRLPVTVRLTADERDRLRAAREPGESESSAARRLLLSALVR